MRPLRMLASVAVTLVWALWLGGLVTLVIFVVMLFHTDRPTALEAAPRMFVTFGKYQLILGAVALVATCLWRMLVKSAWITAIFVLLAVATLGAVALSVRVVPRMEEIRLAGGSDSAEYKRLHSVSSALYMTELGALLLAGAILPAAIRAQVTDGSRRTPPAAARETGSPGGAADRWRGT